MSASGEAPETIGQYLGVERIVHSSTVFSIQVKPGARLTTLAIMGAVMRLARERSEAPEGQEE